MRRVRPGNEINENNGEWFFCKGRESLSCCDWFSMKLHEMMFRIKTFFDSDNNFHYGQRIKRRATYLLRTFIHIKLLKFSFGLSAQPRAIELLWQKVWVNLAEEFFGEISKPLISKDLAFVTIRYDDIYDRHDTKLRSHDLEKSGKKQVNTRVKEILTYKKAPVDLSLIGVTY